MSLTKMVLLFEIEKYLMSPSWSPQISHGVMDVSRDTITFMIISMDKVSCSILCLIIIS